LFDADLADDTLTRVTHGFEGGPSEHAHPPVQAGRDPYAEGDGALSPSFSADGRELAFSSTASNIAYGDGNSPPTLGTSFDGSDAFVVERRVFGADVPQQYVSLAPAGPGTSPAWRVSVTARGQRDGSVLLYVRVPDSGTLSAGARSTVRVRRASSAHGSSKGRRRARSGSRAKLRGVSLSMQTVATRSARSRGEGLLTLTLRLAKRYAALATARGGLSATVKLSFAAAGHPTLHESIEVTFAHIKKRAKGVKGMGATASAGETGVGVSR